MLTVTVPATPNLHLIQLQVVKDQLGIVDGSQDLVLGELIAMVDSACAEYCGIGQGLVAPTFAQQTYTETLPGFGNNNLMVSMTPLLSVASITYQGGTIDSTTYFIDNPKAGFIRSESPWFWTAELQIAAVGLMVAQNSERRAYTVTYTAGYNLPGDPVQTNPLPQVISFAAEDTVKEYWFGRQRDERLISQQVGALRLMYAPKTIPTGLSPRSEELLAQWMRSA